MGSGTNCLGYQQTIRGNGNLTLFNPVTLRQAQCDLAVVVNLVTLGQAQCDLGVYSGHPEPVEG